MGDASARSLKYFEFSDLADASATLDLRRLLDRKKKLDEKARRKGNVRKRGIFFLQIIVQIVRKLFLSWLYSKRKMQLDVEVCPPAF